VLRSLGVDLVERERVVAVDEREIVLSSGAALPSDVTVWAAGFEAHSLARDIGLPVDALGRAFVDARLRSTRCDFVHVIGDAARVELLGRDGTAAPLRMGCATAMPMGAFAADDLARELAGEASKPFAFAYFVRCTSLGRSEGMIQKVDADDRPTRAWLDGAVAAWFKEKVCRFTVASIGRERNKIGYTWPTGRHAPPIAELAS
jgi:NADH dehydrogenase FAD-containing subunit